MYIPYSSQGNRIAIESISLKLSDRFYGEENKKPIYVGSDFVPFTLTSAI